MDTVDETNISAPEATKKPSFIARHFFDKKFLHYTWIGVFISALNVFLLWLFIDVFHIATVIAAIVVVGTTFIVRYLLYIFFKTI